MPRTAIAQLAKLIGQELGSGAGPSEQALATGPMLAEAGATPEIVERLLGEAQRKRPNDRMIQAYAFILEGALETLRLQANGGDVSAQHEIAEIHHRVDHALAQGDFAPECISHPIGTPPQIRAKALTLLGKCKVCRGSDRRRSEPRYAASAEGPDWMPFHSQAVQSRAGARPLAE